MNKVSCSRADKVIFSNQSWVAALMATWSSTSIRKLCGQEDVEFYQSWLKLIRVDHIFKRKNLVRRQWPS